MQRQPVTRLLALAAAATTILAGCSGSSAPDGTGTERALPRGQQVTPVLPAAAGTFADDTAGWEAAAADVSWTTGQGHDEPGALRVRPTGRHGHAVSPAFDVTAHQRYTATGWVRADGGTGKVAMVLQFLSADGQVLHKATQHGQTARTTTRWQRLLPVVGFAPKAAARARALVVTRGPTLVDDVTARTITGTATRLVGPLTTRGRDILDANGRRVVLRGVDLEGLQNIPQTPTDLLVRQVEAAQNWGANVIRLPLNPNNLLLRKCPGYDPDYVGHIRTVVRAVTDRGMLALLDMHAFALEGCGRPDLVSLPDQRGVTFWQRLAPAFADNPLVAFELYNEPNHITDSIWRDGGTVSFNDTTYLGVGMRELYDTVRGTGADNLVFIGGTNYATEVPSTAPLVGTTNVVYAAHAYTCPNGLPSRTIRCAQTGPGGITDPTLILNRFVDLAKTQPVVVDEFGFPDDTDGRYDANVIDYVEAHDWSGWCAFAFDGSNVGLFNLVETVGRYQDPSVNGMSVMTGLARN